MMANLKEKLNGAKAVWPIVVASLVSSAVTIIIFGATTFVKVERRDEWVKATERRLDQVELCQQKFAADTESMKKLLGQMSTDLAVLRALREADINNDTKKFKTQSQSSK